MVTYVYRHTDGSGTFEVQQKITDDRTLEVCPKCGKPVERVVTGGAATLFMGEGWAGKDIESDQRVEERLAQGDIPTTESADTLDYYPGPFEGYVGP